MWAVIAPARPARLPPARRARGPPGPGVPGSGALDPGSGTGGVRYALLLGPPSPVAVRLRRCVRQRVAHRLDLLGRELHLALPFEHLLGVHAGLVAMVDATQHHAAAALV